MLTTAPDCWQIYNASVYIKNLIKTAAGNSYNILFLTVVTSVKIFHIYNFAVVATSFFSKKINVTCCSGYINAKRFYVTEKNH